MKAADWQQGPLSEFVEVNPKEPPLSDDALFVPMAAVDPDRRYVWPTEPRSGRSGARARGGDVLFARITPCLENGKIAQLPETHGRCGGSTEFIVLRAREGLDPSFLYYLATSPVLRAKAANMMIGTTGRQRLAPKDLGRIDVQIPPIREQHRIADLLHAVDLAVERAAESVAAASTLLRSAISQHLASGETWEGIPNTWEVRRLDELAKVRSGLAKGQRSSKGLTPCAFLRAANVQDGFLDLSEIHELYISEDEAERFRLAYGDVLMIEGGNREHVGRGWIWEAQVDPCIHQNHVFAARSLDETVLLPRFLAYAVTASPARAYCLARARQTSNLASINKTQISALPVPLPPIDVQHDLVARFDEIRTVERAAKRLFTSLRHLRDAALAELLTGKMEISKTYDRFLDGRRAANDTAETLVA